MFKERKTIDLQTDLANVIASKVGGSGALRQQQDQAQPTPGPAGPAGGALGTQQDDVVPERINEESDEDNHSKNKVEGRQVGKQPSTYAGQGAPDKMQQIALNVQPEVGGKSHASATFSRETLARQENANQPSAANLPKISRDNSQDASAPDIKSRTNRTASLGAQAAAAA